MQGTDITRINGPELVARWRNSGDEAAATELFGRFAARLIGLVRAHCAEKLRRRFDPEDVVQSAFRSFFVGSRQGRFLLEHSDDLWRLLVSIALHKLYHGAEKHTAQKRSVDREEFTGLDATWCRLFPDRLVNGPSFEAAMQVTEELESIFAGLTTQEHRMLELRLEGYTLDEIAEACECSQRTVRRIIDRIRENVRQQHTQAAAASPEA